MWLSSFSLVCFELQHLVCILVHFFLSLLPPPLPKCHHCHLICCNVLVPLLLPGPCMVHSSYHSVKSLYSVYQIITPLLKVFHLRAEWKPNSLPGPAWYCLSLLAFLVPLCLAQYSGIGHICFFLLFSPSGIVIPGTCWLAFTWGPLNFLCTVWLQSSSTMSAVAWLHHVI